MKIRKINDLPVFRIGDYFFMTRTCQQEINFTEVFTLNFTASYLWELLTLNYSSIDYITGKMYEAFDESISNIKNDIEHQIIEWESMGLVKYEN